MRETAPSRTAEAVAFCRATDQRRAPPDRVLDDPHARLFLSRLFRAALGTLEATGTLGKRTEKLLSPGLIAFVLARHRFIDDHLQRALADGATQVLLLGAGYDTRPWRFAEALKDRTVFEVDHPATAARKAEIVARHSFPAVDRRLIAIDFERESIHDRLVNAGFEVGARTFVVWEGVSMYLTREAVKATVKTVRTLVGPNSRLAMDFWYLVDSPSVVATAHRMSPHLLHLLGEPMTFGIHPEDAPDFMRRLGMRVVDLADAGELERRYVRDGRRVYPATFLILAAPEPESR